MKKAKQFTRMINSISSPSKLFLSFSAFRQIHEHVSTNFLLNTNLQDCDIYNNYTVAVMFTYNLFNNYSTNECTSDMSFWIADKEQSTKLSSVSSYSTRVSRIIVLLNNKHWIKIFQIYFIPT